jgi:hypothetical protein
MSMVLILGLGIRSCAIHYGGSTILVEKNDGQRSVINREPKLV